MEPRRKDCAALISTEHPAWIPGLEEPAGMPKRPVPGRSVLSALRLLATIAALGAVTACTDPVSVALSGASVVSVVQSGKTLSDHAMSAATGMDCSIRNTIAGDSWCMPPINDAPDPSAGLACYRSIAEVTCYRRDNPNETPSRRTQ